MAFGGFSLAESNMCIHNQSVGMNGKQIHNYLKTPCGEIFSEYIVIGFRADNGKPVITGNAGHPVESAHECRLLGDLSNYAQMKITEMKKRKSRNAEED